MATLTLAADASAAAALEETRLARAAAAKDAAAVAALAFPSGVALPKAPQAASDAAQAPLLSEAGAAAADAEAARRTLLRNGVQCKKRSGGTVLKSWLPRFVWVDGVRSSESGEEEKKRPSLCWTKKRRKAESPTESGASMPADCKSVCLDEFASVRAGGATKVELLHADDSKRDVALQFKTATLAAAWRDALLAAVRASPAPPLR
jgi:hypothetical protein